ncbi:MAG: tetraacyldisaccharide 4'-kinase [Candidatus Omnitrophica bacterium]|nr:tetraacyldisaccharide 4'-kinase [Candidatus Omnitrophota bacterium]MBU4333545.1 tetraacyldisaccharide 4'-kinase [Candidatus Omnitrophota bacterium]
MRIKEYFLLVITDKVDGSFVRALKCFLWLISILYGFLATMVCSFYENGILKVNRLNKKVISVGNITLGGVGKTPLVEVIARELKTNGKKPVVLNRGYKDSVSSDESQTKDEARMLERVLEDVPVIVGANRFENAKKYLENNDADVFILDDGFQRWRLHRDLNIVCIDATNPWGNGFLIPRGFLRENLNALKRADMFVITKADLGHKNVNDIVVKLSDINPKADIVKTIHAPIGFTDIRNGQKKDTAFINDKKVIAFCGIGDPQSFVDILKNLGANIIKSDHFIDHHVYDKRDIVRIMDSNGYIKSNIVVTTQKDAVKIEDMLDQFDKGLMVLSLDVGLQFIEGKDKIFERINNILHS